ncbi:MAG: sel1 repeat family protein [Polyangiaceae bacterium]|nr:sel1 repeat family protein [Polyangiaceae bacterium]
MARSLALRATLASLTTLAVFACGGGKVGEALRPKETTGARALGEADGAVDVKACAGSFAEPLVVDIRSSDRTDFETAMKEGVAVVRFDCRSLKLLKNCSLGGSYAFVGAERSEDVVRMQGRDEVSANMPFSGAKLSAEMKSGSTLDLALITVGKRRTGVREVTKKDLEGDCEGATHVVKGAYVGAFALGTGTVGQAKALAEMFGAKAGASSSSDRQAATKSGDIESCRQSTPDANAPPSQCGAITRLELMPVALKRKTVEENKQDDARGGADAKGVVCPQDMVWTGTQCAAQTSESAKAACKPGNGPDCDAKCEAGNAASCVAMRLVYSGLELDEKGHLRHSEAEKPDRAKVARAAKRGCELHDGDSCWEYAGMAANQAREAGKTFEEGESIGRGFIVKACDYGSSEGCLAAGGIAQGSTAPEEAKKALGYFERSCKLGNSSGCKNVALLYLEGKVTTRDPVKALEAYDRACDSGRAVDAFYCADVGKLYAEGKEVTKDLNKAIAAWERGCKGNGARSCYDIGQLYFKGEGVAKDVKRAMEYYARGCTTDARGFDACYALGDALEKGEGVTKDFGKAAAAFQFIPEYSDSRVRAARLLESGGPGLAADSKRSGELWIEACKIAFSPEHIKTACPKADAVVDKVGGADAAAFYAMRCEHTLDSKADPVVCAKMKKLGAKPGSFMAGTLESQCQKDKYGDVCKIWKDLGGTPTDAELKYPPRPARVAAKAAPKAAKK